MEVFLLYLKGLGSTYVNATAVSHIAMKFGELTESKLENCVYSASATLRCWNAFTSHPGHFRRQLPCRSIVGLLKSGITRIVRSLNLKPGPAESACLDTDCKSEALWSCKVAKNSTLAFKSVFVLALRSGGFCFYPTNPSRQSHCRRAILTLLMRNDSWAITTDCSPITRG